MKLTLKNDFRLTCLACGNKYAKTEKGIARIYGSYKFFTALRYLSIVALILTTSGKFFGFNDILLIIAFCLIISFFCLTVAFEALLTGELPSQGPPVYRDINPQFFSVGIAFCFSVAFLGLAVALMMLLK